MWEITSSSLGLTGDWGLPVKSIILLSGPVGAGKTTVAKELIAATSHPLVYIEGDTFWSFIAKGGAAQGMGKNFRTIMSSMTAAAIPYATAGYEVIVDFSIPPWFLGGAHAVVKRFGTPLDYVVLRPSEAVCAARAAARPEGTISDYTSYRDLYSTFDDAARYTISDDEASAGGVAQRIRDGLTAGTFRVR